MRLRGPISVATLALGAMMLSGCDVASDAADQIARDQARGVVNGVVAERFPGADISPVTDCIIDAASAGEILSIARASITGVTPETTQTVLDIASRPDAITCIARNGLSLL